MDVPQRCRIAAGIEICPPFEILMRCFMFMQSIMRSEAPSLRISTDQLLLCNGTEMSHVFCFARTVLTRGRTGSGVPGRGSDGRSPETQRFGAELTMEAR